MSEQNPRLLKPMPQIDFRQAFASAEQKPRRADSAPILTANGAGGAPKQRLARPWGRSIPFNRSNCTNISFVAVTFIGGLFCALYFFNGAEFLRAAAAWPGEFIYSRPFGIAGHDKIDKLHGADDPTSPDSPGSKADPFRKVAFPGLNQPPSPFASFPAAASNPASASSSPSSPPLSPPPQFDPGPLLSGLNPFRAGTDALSQVFNQAVSDLQRLSNLDARRTVVVLDTAPSAARVRAAKAAQEAKRAAQITAANVAAAAGKTAQTVQQTSQGVATTAQNQTASAQNQVASTTQSASGMTQQALNGVHGVTGAGLSGIGGLGAGSGLHVGGGGVLGGGGVHLGGGGHH